MTPDFKSCRLGVPRASASAKACVSAAAALGRKVSRAFTLVEVILAMSISSLVMFGACALMFDMVNVLEYFERGWSFRAHVDGVEKFLRSSFLSSSISDASILGTTYANNSSKTLYLALDPDDGALGEYWLAWGVAEAHPLYLSPFRFSPEKLCFLEFKEGEGLFIIWRFVVSEDKNSEAAVYKTPVSPYVFALAYLYYDETSGWTEENYINTAVGKGMPSYIKIYFEKDGEKYERIISLDSLVDFQISQ